ncbi:MAG: hypothetical protein M5U26_02115 [Planctomycetota bacterium]|nr:hypothetical protein [Planctomycetota bacterium]
MAPDPAGRAPEVELVWLLFKAPLPPDAEFAVEALEQRDEAGAFRYAWKEAPVQGVLNAPSRPRAWGVLIPRVHAAAVRLRRTAGEGGALPACAEFYVGEARW